jgi:hypothetical protein
MQANPVTKCGHPSCRCSVEAEEPFCSAACAESSDTPRDCPCGHAECVGTDQAVEDETEASMPEA